MRSLRNELPQCSGKERGEHQGQGSGRRPERAATKDPEWIAAGLGEGSLGVGWGESSACCPKSRLIHPCDCCWSHSFQRVSILQSWSQRSVYTLKWYRIMTSYNLKRKLEFLIYSKVSKQIIRHRSKIRLGVRDKAWKQEGTWVLFPAKPAQQEETGHTLVLTLTTLISSVLIVFPLPS